MSPVVHDAEADQGNKEERPDHGEHGDQSLVGPAPIVTAGLLNAHSTSLIVRVALILCAAIATLTLKVLVTHDVQAAVV